jgi:Homeodomain-like domain
MSKSGFSLRAKSKAMPGVANISPTGAKKKDIAQRYGVSVRTVDTWIQQKKIPFCRLSSRCIRFELAAAERALSRFYVREIE